MENKFVNIKKLRQKTQLSQEQFARLVNTSWATISRWERNVSKPNQDAETELHRLRELVERIGKALPPDQLYRFLETPNPYFRNHRPIELLKSDYGFEDLLAFVESAKSGDMA
ncbi:MAG: hypothetical protein A3G20_09225 [Acidobacteria bacterium RIFCSPLOWO2_12_FULL_59_11]|nr:MAG: hypothetical protein A3G20_09225 [Acidobacteria bacterium RIFCSPLOWO2_12_FULL_59_11]